MNPTPRKQGGRPPFLSFINSPPPMSADTYPSMRRDLMTRAGGFLSLHFVPTNLVAPRADAAMMRGRSRQVLVADSVVPHRALREYARSRQVPHRRSCSRSSRGRS